jgi:glycosyltransferase involved in cell wall biosynthesis
VVERVALPAVKEDKIVVVLGEEWHTAETMCLLSDALYNQGIRDKAILFWNANNTFSFHRINWGRLNYATVITTISRYMKHIMERMGLHPLVVPNGIPRSLLRRVDGKLANGLRSALGSDIILLKVARWDPDKNWMETVEAVARLKSLGFNTLLLARGGQEPYGQDVINHARSLGLTVKESHPAGGDYDSYVSALAAALPADIVSIRRQMPLDFLAVCYNAADAVLANSGHEPFGIVGLEAMAAGGIVFTGSTGEDYSISFINSFMIETPDPMGIVNYIIYLQNYPQQKERIRESARMTARLFTWEAVLLNLIGKLENQGRIQGVLSSVSAGSSNGAEPAEAMIARQVWEFPDGN